ncbi:hypothetical protein SSP531S_28750 [Streptomyces spongiicola]|uniref:Uncharacterized protein n=1 Tax=Streptomyces spongiicola TaxID=1690221 RepID=A0A388T002_9ACTN|nr:hypothetical protein SSP531S_28750 [Streptomyces spongiicola]
MFRVRGGRLRAASAGTRCPVAALPAARAPSVVSGGVRYRRSVRRRARRPRRRRRWARPAAPEDQRNEGYGASRPDGGLGRDDQSAAVREQQQPEHGGRERRGGGGAERGRTLPPGYVTAGNRQAVTKRAPADGNGGMVSTTTRMPRYVEPHTT